MGSVTDLTFTVFAGFAVTFIIVCIIGIYSGKSIKTSADFLTGGSKSGFLLVAGTIMGTLIGGNATIGTSQLAHSFGYSALWFTLGSSVGCLFLGFFSKRIRMSGCNTIQQLIGKEYGKTAAFLCSILGIAGLFINLVGQLLASVALFGTLLPISKTYCAILSILTMGIFVFFGGVKGAGAVGSIKMVLLYVTVIACGTTAIYTVGSFSFFRDNLPAAQYFSLFARGIDVDLGSGLSLVLGVLSTQTYFQAIISAKNDKHALAGALVSAALIPPIGFGSVYIGMFMKLKHPHLPASEAFPHFIGLYMPAIFAGIAFAALLIAIIGTGSGLTLGVSTIITSDIYSRIRPERDSAKQLLVSRVSIIATLVVSVFFLFGNLQSIILQWGFMSMGLRAATAFFPMCGALFFRGKLKYRFVLASMVIGPAIVMSAKLFSINFDPLLLGMAAALIVMLLGADKASL